MYIASSAVSEILSTMSSLGTGPDDLFVLFFADADVPDIEELRRACTREGFRFMGGIVPGLIVGTTLKASGTLIQRYACSSGPFVVYDPETEDIPASIVGRVEMPSDRDVGTVMMYLPGHTSASHFLHQIYGLFGNAVTYIGSGMGYEDEVCRPCVFSNDVFSDSAAVFAVLSRECTMDARHGFLPISEPMVSTLTDKNRVLEINWKDPWNEYRDAIGEESGREYPGTEPEDCIAKYPLLFQMDYPESVCRGVLQITPEGSLVCAGDIPENAVFRVGKYSFESMFAAAALSAQNAMSGMNGRPSLLFLIDCVSRKWNAGAQYREELLAIEQVLSERPGLCSVEGILSFGEISSMGTGMIEYLNYTCVAGRFYET